MTPLLPPPYVIRLALELDGFVIEERFVEPNEIVHIGHEQRSNLLCWGRLPKSVQLFTYEHGQPVVRISPRWLTQKNTQQISISPHSHPSQRYIPTPLRPGQCFTLDLDGALLHIERQDFFTKTFDATHLDVPTFSPDSSSRRAPYIALGSLLLCSLVWSVMVTRSVEPMSSLTPQASATTRSSAMVGASVQTDKTPYSISYKEVDPLSWEEREVQRLLQSRSSDYRNCFSTTTKENMHIFFELDVEPHADRSLIAHVDTASSSVKGAKLLNCLTKSLHRVRLPRYDRAFTVEFNVGFDPSVELN